MKGDIRAALRRIRTDRLLSTSLVLNGHAPAPEDGGHSPRDTVCVTSLYAGNEEQMVGLISQVLDQLEEANKESEQLERFKKWWSRQKYSK